MAGASASAIFIFYGLFFYGQFFPWTVIAIACYFYGQLFYSLLFLRSVLSMASFSIASYFYGLLLDQGENSVELTILFGQITSCLVSDDFATDSVTVIGLLGTSSDTQWVILLYWVPPDRVLLRFCVTEPYAELFPYGEKGVWPYGSALNVFPYGEKGVWPYGSALNVFPYGERVVWPDGSPLNVFPYGERVVRGSCEK